MLVLALLTTLAAGVAAILPACPPPSLTLTTGSEEVTGELQLDAPSLTWQVKAKLTKIR